MFVRSRESFPALFLAVAACTTPTASPTHRTASLSAPDEASAPPLREDEYARLDETHSLGTPRDRAAARAELFDELLRERLEEAGVLEAVERDPAGSSAIVETYSAGLREEFDETIAADDRAFFEATVADAASRWEPTEGEMAAAEATLEVARLEGGEERGSVGSYGPEATRARSAELASHGGVR